MTPSELRALREIAFRRVFGIEGSRSMEQTVVLAHLNAYCLKHSTTFVAGDAHSSAHLEGRREVLLEIEKHVNPRPRTVKQILGAKPSSTSEEATEDGN